MDASKLIRNAEKASNHNNILNKRSEYLSEKCLLFTPTLKTLTSKRGVTQASIYSALIKFK